ncbi:hypothetical protein HanRHA438_Chr08g0345861 [Helianthus annuus]|nr:hypothetical protein HanRHA438_Chr08g0345861 [Helianthus annuus]
MFAKMAEGRVVHYPGCCLGFVENRNNVVFNNKYSDFSRLKKDVKPLGYLYVKHRTKQHDLSWED